MAKFEKGNPGGPGRPAGSHNTVNRRLDGLVSDDAPDSPPEEPVAAPSPKEEVWTHDPPEQLQIEKVAWRRRGPEDDLADEEEDEYYDPLKHA